MKTFSRTLFGSAVGVGVILLLGVNAGLMLSRKSVSEVPDTVILAKVRQLGNLHTVAFSYQTVTSPTSHADVPDQWKPVPGAVILVENLTRNKAVVSHTVEIESGVELSKADIVRDGNRLTVLLPAPEIYPARVTSRVLDQSGSWIWTDRNLVTHDQQTVSRAAVDWAKKDGILSQAKSNSEATVAKLLTGLGIKNIVVRYRPVTVEKF